MAEKDFMTKKVIYVSPTTKVAKAADIMKEQGIHRLPAAQRKGLSVYRPRSQVRGQKPARRQGAGAQIRQVAKLPLRHPLQRQPSLLLGS